VLKLKAFVLLFLLPFLSFCQLPALVFAKGMGSAGTDNGNSIVVNQLKEIFIGGDFTGNIDLDPGSGVTSFSSVGLYDAFFGKYSTTGNLLWAHALGSGGRETVNSIALDKYSNCYITGYYEGNIDFDPGPANNMLFSSGAGRDIFFAKYDSNGNYLWAKSINGGNTDISNALVIDSTGNFYVTGYFSQIVDFDPGPGTATLSGNSQGIFFAKYDSAGNYVWAKSLESIGYNEGHDINLDKSGNIYLTGFFANNLDFDPSPATATLSGGSRSIFCAKYDNSGNYLWANKIGSSSYNNSFAVCVDNNNSILITGVFAGTQDFDPGVATSTITSAGFGDIFISKYDSLGNYIWAKSIGSPAWEEAYTIAVDNNNNILLSGYYTNSIDFDPGAAVYTLSGTTQPSIFLSSFDPSGNFNWVTGFGVQNSNFGNQIKVDDNNDIYLVGSFSDNVDFDPSSLSTVLNSTGDTDIFFAKYSSPVLGIEQNEIEYGFIYPNPVSDLLNVRVPISNGSLVICNVTGQPVKTFEILQGENTYCLRELPKGLYFYSILKNNHTVKNGKLIKE
jgi:uncharacterized protein (DUF2249 family)